MLPTFRGFDGLTVAEDYWQQRSLEPDAKSWLMVVFTDNSGVIWKCIAGRCLITAELYLKLANVRNQRTNK